MTEQNDSKRKIQKWHIVALFAGVVVAWVFCVPLVNILAGRLAVLAPEIWRSHGTFGDTFGVINALFSGLAFAGIIIAILLQKEELELQRNDLKRSADAQDKTQEALNAQLKVMVETAKLNCLPTLIEAQKAIISHAKSVAPMIRDGMSEQAHTAATAEWNKIYAEERKFEQFQKDALKIYDKLNGENSPNA